MLLTINFAFVRLRRQLTALLSLLHHLDSEVSDRLGLLEFVFLLLL